MMRPATKQSRAELSSVMEAGFLCAAHVFSESGILKKTSSSQKGSDVPMIGCERASQRNEIEEPTTGENYSSVFANAAPFDGDHRIQTLLVLVRIGHIQATGADNLRATHSKA